MGSTTILNEIHHCVLKQHSPKIFEKKISIIIKIKQIKSETKTNKGKETFSLNQRLYYRWLPICVLILCTEIIINIHFHMLNYKLLYRHYRYIESLLHLVNELKRLIVSFAISQLCAKHVFDNNRTYEK